MFASLAVLTYGGFMTVSKVFIVVALPIAIFQLVGLRRRRGEVIAGLTTTGLLAYLIVKSGILPEWSGGYQLAQLLPSQDRSLLASLTASRFGENSTLESAVTSVLTASPVTGMGAGGLDTPYDNAFVEALIVAGMVGVFSYSGVLAWLYLSWRRQTPSAERTYLGGLVILVAGASMGLPALTANRCATVVWVLLAGLLLSNSAPSHERRVAASAVNGPVRRTVARSSTARAVSGSQ